MNNENYIELHKKHNLNTYIENVSIINQLYKFNSDVINDINMKRCSNKLLNEILTFDKDDNSYSFSSIIFKKIEAAVKQHQFSCVIQKKSISVFPNIIERLSKIKKEKEENESL